jgi:hypothetical protein
MEERAERLLLMEPDDLFNHGGCHIFAIALNRRFGYPLLLIQSNSGDHRHVCCTPEQGEILDVYGWFTFADYRVAEILTDREVHFLPIQLADLQSRFTYGGGNGFYAHKDFWQPAMIRAEEWINIHVEYFSGKRKISIPGHKRLKCASDPIHQNN